jgi:WD40 repeat protein
LLNLPDSLQATSFAFSVDEEYLAIGNADGSIYLVQFSNGGVGASGLIPQSHTAPVRAMAWSHEGHTLASVSGMLGASTQAEWTLKVWNLEAYNPLTKILPPLQINYAYPYPLSDVAFSANDQYVAITGESPADERAALWIYSLADAQEQFSKGLVYMQGFTFVSDTPDASVGDFVYGNGDEADKITLDGKQDTVFYSDSGLFLGEVEFRPQVIEGAEILFAVRNATPGAFSGAETITFINAVNTASPSGTLTLSAVDIAFSPDGRVLAAIDAESGTVFLLGVTDS